MRPILMAAAVAMLTSQAQAVPVPIQFVAPCTNADSPIEPYDPCDTTGASVLHNLDAILVWAQRAGQVDSTLVQTIPAQGAECDTLQGAPDLAPGHTYRLWCQPRKFSGAMASCRGPEILVAIPPVTAVEEWASDPPVSTMLFDVNGRKVEAMEHEGIYFSRSLTRSGRRTTETGLWISGRWIRLRRAQP